MGMTQAECWHDFIDLLDRFVKEVDAIDARTPATDRPGGNPIEPRWWLEMMAMRKTASDLIRSA